jgi:hypothetical protein
MTEHKHAEELRAIADGKEVEGYFFGIWKEANDEFNPLNFPNTVWRIKPQVLRYRVALMCDATKKFYLAFETTKGGAYSAGECNGFIKWLHDWQEVEVES